MCGKNGKTPGGAGFEGSEYFPLRLRLTILFMKIVKHTVLHTMKLPLKRGWLRQKKPGMAWEVANGVKSSYHLNTGTGEFACKRYVVNQEDGSLSPKGTYPKNNLRIIKTTDEDNREVLTFKDMNDSTILIRRNATAGFLIHTMSMIFTTG